MLTGPPQAPDLAVAENAVTGDFGRRTLYTETGRHSDHVARGQPAKQPADDPKRAIAHIGATLVRDALDQIDHITPADRGHAAATPGRQYEALERFLSLRPGPHPALGVLLDELRRK